MDMMPIASKKRTTITSSTRSTVCPPLTAFIVLRLLACTHPVARLPLLVATPALCRHPGMWNDPHTLSNSLEEKAPDIRGTVTVADCAASPQKWLFGHVGALRPVQLQDLCIDPFVSAPHLVLVQCKGVPKERQKFRLLKARLKEMHGPKCVTAQADGKASMAECTGEPDQVGFPGRLAQSVFTPLPMHAVMPGMLQRYRLVAWLCSPLADTPSPGLAVWRPPQLRMEVWIQQVLRLHHLEIDRQLSKWQS